MVLLERATVRPVTVDAWDRLLQPFGQRTVFHGRPWLELLAASYGVQPQLLVLADPSGEPLAALPALEQRKGPFRVLGSPLPGWNTAYMGPVFAHGVDPRTACAALLDAEPVRAASYLDLRVHDPLDQVDLAPLGFTRQERFETYLLSLAPAETVLWDGLDGKCRNMVRKGERNGYAVREERDAGWIGDFVGMLQEVFARWELRPPCDRDFLERMWSQLRPHGQIAVHSAFHGAERAASAVILRDHATAYYWMGATFDRHRQQSPNNLLLWEAIRAAKAHGCRTFDFVSASGSAGKFKESFGPELVAISNRWSRSRTAVEGWLKTGYEGWLRWRRRARSAG